MHHPLSHEYILLIGGALLLLLGRKLFWLSVAVIGFVLGAELAAQFLPHQSETVKLAVEIGVGLLGALLAIYVQELAIGIAGFFLGGELGLLLCRAVAFYNPHYWWLAFLVGGVVGAIVSVSFFDWGLIILSSLAGAHLIVDAIHTTHVIKIAGFVALVMVGIICQASILGKRKPARE